MPESPHPLVYRPLLEAALREDLGGLGDLTTDGVVESAAVARAALVTRSSGRIAGLGIALDVFTLVDPAVHRQLRLGDGADVRSGDVLATVAGPARAILTAERTSLNLLGHLSGIATATRRLVESIDGTGAVIADTRKTTPGMRALEKYAVRVGGGKNHRYGLADAVLIKDNHLAVAGGIRVAVERVRRHIGHTIKVEVEVDDLDQLAEALEVGVEAVLLDNMTPDEIRRAVEIVDGRVIVEASGGITLESAAAVAAAGVDVLSVGWITHSAPALDVALDMLA